MKGGGGVWQEFSGVAYGMGYSATGSRRGVSGLDSYSYARRRRNQGCIHNEVVDGPRVVEDALEANNRDFLFLFFRSSGGWIKIRSKA